MKRSTVGRHLCVQWKDGSTLWEKLSDMKESHPIKTAEYSVAQGIDHEPAFNWWVLHVIKKRSVIISLVEQRNTRYLKQSHKFGIQLPKSAQEARNFDRQNCNQYCQEAIDKKIRNVRRTFQILGNEGTIPVGYKHVHCHMIFDIKMENFRRKPDLSPGDT